MIITEIKEALKKAMMMKDAPRLECLRSVSTAFTNLEKSGKSAIVESDYMSVLQKLYKQRIESGDMYKTAYRYDLMDIELAEAAIINEFIPQALSQDQVLLLVHEVIKENNYTLTKKDMGKIVKDTVSKAVGMTDGKVVSNIVLGLITLAELV